MDLNCHRAVNCRKDLHSRRDSISRRALYSRTDKDQSMEWFPRAQYSHQISSIQALVYREATDSLRYRVCRHSAFHDVSVILSCSLLLIIDFECDSVNCFYSLMFFFYFTVHKLPSFSTSYLKTPVFHLPSFSKPTFTLPKGQRLPKGYRFPRGFKFPKGTLPKGYKPPKNGKLPGKIIKQLPRGFKFPIRGLPQYRKAHPSKQMFDAFYRLVLEYIFLFKRYSNIIKQQLIIDKTTG